MAGETRDYKPRHDTQYEPSNAFSPLDCNMAAAADAGRYYSLGLKDHNHYWYRLRAQNPDGSQDRTGGTNIEQAAEVLDDAGVPSVHYTMGEGQNVHEALAVLETRGILIAHGDYGSVPVSLRGPISRTFTGLHSVVFQDLLPGKKVRVGDGLSDDWMEWPYEVAYRYMFDFPGSATYLVVRPRLLGPRYDQAAVRVSPSNEIARYTTLKTGDRVHVGGIVRGQELRETRNWYRVWCENRIGYVHATRGEIVVPR